MSHDDESSRYVEPFINKALAEAIAKDASDIHFEPMDGCMRVRFRLDGALWEWAICPEKLQASVVNQIKVMIDSALTNDEYPHFGRLKLRFPGDKEVGFAVSVLPGILGEKVVLQRRTKGHSFKLDVDSLGMEEKQLGQFRNAIHQRQGIVLLSGPTGSGKHITIYSALSELNSTERSIATVEWVPRGNLPGVHHMMRNDESGLNFAAAMRCFMRFDADVVYVRDLEDLETALLMVRAVLQCSMLLFTTVHTSDAASTFDRLINMGVEPGLITESVSLIQAQRLLRKLCPGCREKGEVSPEAFIKAGLAAEEAAHSTVYKAVGCALCHNTGYRGQVLACETMPLTKELKRQLLSGKSSEDLKRVAIEEGMRTLRMTGLSRMCEGLTTLEEVLLETPPDLEIRP